MTVCCECSLTRQNDKTRSNRSNNSLSHFISKTDGGLLKKTRKCRRIPSTPLIELAANGTERFDMMRTCRYRMEEGRTSDLPLQPSRRPRTRNDKFRQLGYVMRSGRPGVPRRHYVVCVGLIEINDSCSVGRQVASMRCA